MVPIKVFSSPQELLQCRILAYHLHCLALTSINPCLPSLCQEFLQEVASYQPALDDVTLAEEALLTTDIATIKTCEAAVVRQTALYRRSSTPRGVSVVSPVPLVST